MTKTKTLIATLSTVGLQPGMEWITSFTPQFWGLHETAEDGLQQIEFVGVNILRPLLQELHDLQEDIDEDLKDWEFRIGLTIDGQPEFEYAVFFPDLDESYTTDAEDRLVFQPIKSSDRPERQWPDELPVELQRTPTIPTEPLKPGETPYSFIAPVESRLEHWVYFNDRRFEGLVEIVWSVQQGKTYGQAVFNSMNGHPIFSILPKYAWEHCEPLNSQEKPIRALPDLDKLDICIVSKFRDAVHSQTLRGVKFDTETSSRSVGDMELSVCASFTADECIPWRMEAM